jgi:hypothetical protein
MIKPNFEALSITELQYIARKQGIDDLESMDRDDILEALQEIYEENDNAIALDGSPYAPSSQKRFMSTLVEHNSEVWIGDLPGVERLPESYSETSIHLMLKDPFWAHAYWSVCLNEVLKLEQSEENYHFTLRVSMLESSLGAGDGDSYDITVNKTDSNWNVNLPKQGRSYMVSLHYAFQAGKTGQLCQSSVITSPKCYWLDHTELLNRNADRFNLLFSSLATKGGILVDNPLVHEIVARMEEQRRG